MRAAGVIAALLMAVVGVPVVAQTLPWQVEAGAGVDHHSNGAPDWRQADLSLRRQLAPRSVAELSLRSTRRSGLSDEELGAAVGLPLSQRWSLALAATLSPSHRVLARGSGRVELTRAFDDGWVAGASFGRRLYDDGGNSQWGLGLERYVAAWRMAAGVGQTRLDGGGAASSLRLQLDRYFADERGRVGVIVASGRELEGVPATPGVSADLIDQRVRTLAVTGAWPVAADWALTAEASHVRHDDVRRRSGAVASAPYQRSGVRLGVRHDF
jgi:YaiO family outer membrane protein